MLFNQSMHEYSNTFGLVYRFLNSSHRQTHATKQGKIFDSWCDIQSGVKLFSFKAKIYCECSPIFSNRQHARYPRLVTELEFEWTRFVWTCPCFNHIYFLFKVSFKKSNALHYVILEFLHMSSVSKRTLSITPCTQSRRKWAQNPMSTNIWKSCNYLLEVFWIWDISTSRLQKKCLNIAHFSIQWIHQ